MEVQVDTSKIISLRKSRAWSQQQLAEVASVSLRTIQRIEKSGNASQESVKSISSAFSIVPEDILVKESEKFSVVKRIKNYIAAILVLRGASLLYASFSTASPIMLKVDASSNNEQLASIQLLNEEGAESEMRINNMLKIELSTEQTPENQIRLKTKVYEFKESTGFVLVASPVLLPEIS
ncbi:helix-turn-helix transcriptional regulator [Microbulbifer variabilis]|uniref:helix-turn-helix transcriptional regulator n=1 Tax=Microbulbifer variabilis TaxID=266805 RepID=UPI001CFD34DB|nr:helix-turn-helix transcriptional regulator [Microbulbifer variabilis]